MTDRRTGWWSLWIVLVVSVGCGEGFDQEVPADTDAQQGADAGDTEVRDAEEGGEEVGPDAGPEMTGPFADELRRPVEVMTDEFGMRHIYAESLEDLFFMNGLVYAEDRFGQMEFFRRIATGTLAEVLGGLDDEPIETDVLMRMLGLKRSAKAYWEEQYDPDKEGFALIEAYCRGVNAYLEKRREGEVDESAAVRQMFPPESTREWEPSDVLAVGKLLAVQLTYAADPEIEFTQFRDEILSTYDAEASDPDLAARDGLLHDLVRFAPATRTTHIEEVPDGGEALKAESKRPEVDPELIENALDLHRSWTDLPMVEGNPLSAGSWLSTGSNNWVLSGELTESGHPNVANDPHQGLPMPSVFYPIHLHLEDDVDGREPIEVVGASILGVPGVVVGRTDDVAWGTTNGYYDYVDVYREKLTGPSDGSEPAKVEHEGEEVPVEQITEEIRVGSFGSIQEDETIELNLEVVPHHGPIIPQLDENNRPVARTENEALSVQWVGLEANNDFQFLVNLYRAENPDEVEEALDYYSVGSNNFVFGFTSGDIFYSGQSDIPVRPEAAMTFDPATNPTGNSPTFILPGDGSADWEGFLPEERIPHVRNPEKGYVVTANNDHVGGTLDNDPFNDDDFLGALFPNGFRATRITNLIEAPEQVGDGDEKLGLAEQVTIQNDGKDLVASKIAPHMVNIVNAVLDDSVPESVAPDLGDARRLVEEREQGEEELAELRDLLDGWDYQSPGTREPTGEDARRSAAATLFNTTMVYLVRGTFGDEFRALDRYRSGKLDVPFAEHLVARVLIWALENPREAETYDEEVGDVLLFDDMETDDRTETRFFQIVRALFRAKDRLASDDELGERFGRPIPSPGSADPEDWVWGNVHGARLESLLPLGKGEYQRPTADEVDGLPFYPRPGGQFAVSPCNPGYGDFDFTCSSGSSLRMVHDMDPEEPVTYNALPGGYSMNPEDETYMSEFDLWQTPPEPRRLETDPEAVREDARSVQTYGAYAD